MKKSSRWKSAVNISNWAATKTFFAYFYAHYRHFFPKLTERSKFVRQAANLWQVKAALQKRLVMVSGQTQDPVQVIDTLPLPVCVITRAVRDHCFPQEADFGYCAAKDLHYYGFKLGLRISRIGMITHYPLLAARPHDIHSLDTLSWQNDFGHPPDNWLKKETLLAGLPNSSALITRI
jgi:hypothetical protein